MSLASVYMELHECSPSAIADASLDNGNARSPPISLHHTIAHTHIWAQALKCKFYRVRAFGQLFCYVIRIVHSLSMHASTL